MKCVVGFDFPCDECYYKICEDLYSDDEFEEEQTVCNYTGNPKCISGWCGTEFPKKCKCGGLIHADFGDESTDGDYWLYKKCDKCGDSYEEDD